MTAPNLFRLLALLGALLAVPMGAHAQSGSLAGKIVYLEPGHGRYDTGSSWAFQRSVLLDNVEDLNNQDAATELAETLLRAGATVVPMRPIGRQPIEVVVDNDDPGVAFAGAWSDSTDPVFFGSPGDVPYRFALTSATETATATYTPVLPAAGFYPVYTWVRHGANRVEQLYRIAHSGGTARVRVDHRRVGNGYVYLGTYHFEAGVSGSVTVSNAFDNTGVVIADAIRFGNGMGDYVGGNGLTSGLPRADEASLYWLLAQLGQGTPETTFRPLASDFDSNIRAPARWAVHMNREQAGAPSDRVLVSLHSNAFNGAARGALSLVSAGNPTPNQALLAQTLTDEIAADLTTLSPGLEHDWFVRASPTLAGAYGLLSNATIAGEFDATIVERAFHDNPLDMRLLHDPKVNRALARATVEGLTRFFRDLDGVTPLVFLPSAPRDASAVSDGAGTVTVTWKAPIDPAGIGSPPAAYVVEGSPNGLGFEPVGETTGLSVTVSGFDPGDVLRYFRVRARNDAGLSRPTAVMATTPYSAPGAARFLYVNAFDRLDRAQLPEQVVPGLPRMLRIDERRINSGDYAVQSATAALDGAAAIGLTLHIDSADHLALFAHPLDLGSYDVAHWSLGEESFADETFNALEQLLVEDFVAAGGHLIASGPEIAWDLGFLGAGPAFLEGTLGASFVADDAGAYRVVGFPLTPFQELDLTFDDGTDFFDSEFPDVLAPVAPAQTVLRYDTGSVAGVATPPSVTRGGVLTLGFPVVTVTDPLGRADLLAAAFDFFALAPCPADTNSDGILDNGDISAFVALFLAGDPAADFTGDGILDNGDISAFVAAFLAGC
ncbi:MAG: GC-type dockerin domain-anchored protein [Phycisphaerales bacterium JB040]